ncbi:MAG: amidohydrolase family protein [Pseudomonadota bacterium]
MTGLKKPHVHPVDEAWLALGAEPRTNRTIEIVDSHIHLWDFSDPPYFADSYARDAAAAGISSCIYVDCTMGYRGSGPVELRPAGEVEFARAQAEAVPAGINVGAAIIGWADLTLGDAVGEVLAELRRVGDGRFRGVRCRATYDPDPQAGYGAGGPGPGLLLREDFQRGVRRLHEDGHVLDLYAFHTQLREVAALAQCFPDLPIVLNHIGGPLGIGRYANLREQVYADWAAGMSEVAQCPNVVVKIGGFAISRVAIVDAAGRALPPSSAEVAELCRPWVRHCIDAFGADRCMFGSNFPVDKVAMPLTTLVNAMMVLTADLSLADQQAFFGRTAMETYGL